MENEQFEKRVDWLDSERRKADQTITQLEKRVALLEEALASNQELTNAYKREMSRLNTTADRIAEFSREIRTNKSEIETEVHSNAEESKKHQREFENRLQVEQRKVGETIESLRKDLGEIDALRSEVRARQAGEARLGERIEELNRSLETVNKNEVERQELAASLEDARKKDDRRISEMQGEVSATVGLSEKTLARVEKIADDQRRVQNKFEDLASQVKKNHEAQQEKSKQMAADQLSRERVWSDWETRFETIERQSEEIAVRLKDIEIIDLAVKRARSSFDDLVEKINRRVNELTEVQRLGEQRFRQEWSTFQADSQKRWSGFKLGQEESQRQAARQRDKLTEQATQLEDSLQDVRDITQHLSEQTERYLQNLMESVQDSLAERERFFNSTR